MIFRLSVLVLLYSSLAESAQPSAVKPVPAPLRELVLGDLNFLHTTDSHGWHAGHLLEASYSADWGDYIDFSDRLKEQLEAEGKDLLVIDTGDRIEGNGLYDSSEPKGKYTFNIFKEKKIDIICSGNHELYKQNSSENEYFITVPAYKDNYLASNLDIVNPNTGEIVPLAHRFKKFTTPKQGIRITAFGFIFDFTGNYNNTIITPVEDTVRQDWFRKAIHDADVDIFVVIGHVALRQGEFETIFKAIRAVRPNIPIQFFGGHFHVRDYRVFDERSHALASGRFMETIGFQSISNIKSKKPPIFHRRYIDNNLYSFYHHTRTNSTTFHSDHGRRVSKLIEDSRRALSLDTTFGCAPHDLWMSRAPYPSKTSIFSWLVDRVLPDVNNPNRKDKPRIIITNTGAIRFDIFKGPFTKDSTYIVSPFTSGLRYLKAVPYGRAKRLLPLLNNQGQISGGEITAITLDMVDPKLATWKLAPPEQYGMRQEIIRSQTETEDDRASLHRHKQHAMNKVSNNKPELIDGYTTEDDLGDDGDDTIHSPIDFYLVPNCVQAVIDPKSMNSAETSLRDTDEVDLVFNEFLQPWALLGLRFLGLEYTDADVDEYLPNKDFTSIIADWVGRNWKENCK